jgi:hypothetical protein
MNTIYEKRIYAIKVGEMGEVMKELLGLTDGCRLVGGFETLCVGLAPQITTHLPITAGESFEDT